MYVFMPIDYDLVKKKFEMTLSLYSCRHNSDGTQTNILSEFISKEKLMHEFCGNWVSILKHFIMR